MAPSKRQCTRALALALAWRRSRQYVALGEVGMEPAVVWRSERAVVLDKPAGWLSVPSSRGVAEPRPVLGIWAQEQFGRVWPVHRLDEPVSGLVLVALDADLHRAACGWFDGHAVVKTYAAWSEVHAAPPVGEETWTGRLLEGKKRSYADPRGREVVTEVLAEGREGPWLRWRLRPRTGRRHQLRVELARRGFPLAGDVLYGAAAWDRPGIGLRAVALDLPAAAGAFGLPGRIEVAGASLMR
jgi:23S rRNA-/tRNA-specific pseudouridylate synthase